MALHDNLTHHVTDTERLARMLDTLWCRMAGQSRPDSGQDSMAMPSVPGVVDLLGQARGHTRTGLDIAQALLDLIGPDEVAMVPASSGGVSRMVWDGGVISPSMQYGER